MKRSIMSNCLASQLVPATFQTVPFVYNFVTKFAHVAALGLAGLQGDAPPLQHW